MSADKDLQLLTRILGARLAQKAVIDYNIMNRETCLSPGDINQHFGRFVGYFTRRPQGDVCFILFARSNLMEDFDRVFAYYVNKKFFHIPKSESSAYAFKSKTKLEPTVQMIQTDALKVFHPSVMIQMIVFTLSIHLLQDYKKYRLLKTGGSDLFLCFNPQIGFPNCEPTELDDEAQRLREHIISRGFVCDTLDSTKPKNINADVDLLTVRYRSHLVFGIHYKNDKILNVLLPHVVQFAYQNEVKGLTALINRAFGSYQLSNIVASRLYSTANDVCNGATAMKACTLALHHPYISIRDEELHAVMAESRLLKPIELPTQSNVSSTQSSRSLVIDDLEMSSPIDLATIEHHIDDDDVCEVVSLNCGDLEPPEPPIRASQMSSQGTVIMGEDEVQVHLDFLASRRKAKDVLALPYPIDNGIQAHSDPEDEYIMSKEFYLSQVGRMVSTFVGYTTATMVDPSTLDNFQDEVGRTDQYKARFLVVPIVDEQADALIVVDRQNEEWGYLNPDNLAWRYRHVFERTKASIGRSSSLLANYVGEAINMTSYYHTNYPRLHLLMALFHISKSFRYAAVLPRKVVYREKDFRAYAHQLYHELAVANALYNHENCLVKRNGFLHERAYKSMPSPIQFERAVVHEDQCVFCKRRGFRNLGSHMSMEHGGYGIRNVGRRWGRQN